AAPAARAVSTHRVALEKGIRPLPWPLWRGRHGSARATVRVLAVWLLSLGLALGAQRFGWRLPASSLLQSAVLHLPWTLAVLWTVAGGFEYGLALLLACGLSEFNFLGHPAWFAEMS